MSNTPGKTISVANTEPTTGSPTVGSGASTLLSPGSNVVSLTIDPSSEWTGEAGVYFQPYLDGPVYELNPSKIVSPETGGTGIASGATGLFEIQVNGNGYAWLIASSLTGSLLVTITSGPGTSSQFSASDGSIASLGTTTDAQATDSTSAWSLVALAKGSLKQAELSNTPPSDGFNQTYVMTTGGTAQQGPNHVLTGGYVTIKCPQSNSQPLIWGWSNAVGSTDVAGNNGSAIYPGTGASVNLSNLDQLWLNNPNTTDRYVLEAA